MLNQQNHGRLKKPRQAHDGGHQVLAALDTKADALAREVYERDPETHHGVTYLAGQGLALVFNNEPPHEDPTGRAEDLVRFRKRLVAEGLHEVASSNYPRRTTSKGHTMVFLIRATKREASSITSWIGSAMRTPDFRKWLRKSLAENGIPLEAVDDLDPTAPRYSSVLQHPLDVTINLSEVTSDFTVEFMWDNPPDAKFFEQSCERALLMRDAMVEVAARLWDCEPTALKVSSPQRPSSPAKNCSVSWEVAAPPSSRRWKGVRAEVCFCDPWNMFSYAPHRFDVFVTPYLSDPMAANDQDVSPASARRVAEILDACKRSLCALVEIAYQVKVASVELTDPSWEKECVTGEGLDAFRCGGVVQTEGWSSSAQEQ